MNYACVKSDNEIYWSPVPKPEFNAWRDSEETEQSALKAFGDGLVRFEDQEAVRELMLIEECKFGHDPNDDIEPGTCLPIEVEGEKIVQVNKDFGATNTWEDVDGPNDYPASCHRVVFRITK